jgi:phage replication O-like protein O
MASPQKENGYTPISNELLDVVLRTNFVATHLKLILCCCRYTYGFSRKEAELSESYICKAIGVSHRYVSQELNTLIDMRVITVVKESTYTSSRIIALNKNYDEWGSRTTVPQVNHSSTVEPEQDTPVELQFTTPVEPQFHQDKQELKQDIKQRDIDAFFEKAWGMYPRKEGKGSVSITQKKKLFVLGDEFIRCIERYAKSRIGEEPKFTKQGSTFFNSGYIDYLDKNFNQQQIEIPKPEASKWQKVSYKSTD